MIHLKTLLNEQNLDPIFKNFLEAVATYKSNVNPDDITVEATP